MNISDFCWPCERFGEGVEGVLRGAGPAFLRIVTSEGPRFLLLLDSRFGRARLIGPDLALHTCAFEPLRATICDVYEAPLMESIDGLLDAANIDSSRRVNVRAAIARERLAEQRIGGFWMLRLPPTANFAAQLVREKAPRRLATMLVLFAAVYVLGILGWSVIGDAALNGRVDFGWLAAWVLMVLSAIPLRLLGAWIDSTLAIDVGGLLKLRLLLGALRLNVEAVKSQGVGQMLCRVMESQALESLAVNGGLAAIVAVMELAFAAWILGMGAGGILHLALLAFWLAVTFALGWRFYKRLSD